jgi:hypothetical protein
MKIEVGKVYCVKHFVGRRFYFKGGISAKEIEAGDIFCVIACPSIVKIPRITDHDKFWCDILHSDGQVYALWASMCKDFLEEL